MNLCDDAYFHGARTVPAPARRFKSWRRFRPVVSKLDAAADAIAYPPGMGSRAGARTLRHGTRVEYDRGMPVRWIDRGGTVALECQWQERRLDRARLRIPDGRQVVLSGRAGHHPLLGVTDTVAIEGAAPLAGCAEVEWSAPVVIPALDRPGSLPPGAGTAVLGFLAWRCAEAGIGALRYRGPYPTGALFDALLECFAVAGDPASAFTRFSAEVVRAAATGVAVEPQVEFRPAPFERRWQPGVCAQLRDGLERVWLGPLAFARDRAGSRRLRADGDGWEATVELGGLRWATVARLGSEGELIEGPHAPPPLSAALLGRPLPAGVRAALVEALPPRAPPLLQPQVRAVLETAPLRWGDAGTEPARADGDEIVVHAALVELLAAEPPALLEAVAAAVEPVAHRLGQRRLLATLED
jgi:hypothetical protein